KALSASSSQMLSDVEIAVFGSRAHLEKQALATRKWYRNFLMKGFHLVVLLTAGPGIRDTQVWLQDVHSICCEETLYKHQIKEVVF
uniref:Uncharacterized protein n=1 Tax=Aegilops tauschii subsp. strangulata TaxID=200361 RepID=A0A453MA34_AEGTS